jgi:hypothetical protein
MKQIKEGLERFLKRKGSLKRRKRCVEKRGIKGCDECKQWPCELLKRPVLVPVDLEKFKSSWRKSRNVGEVTGAATEDIYRNLKGDAG